MELAMENQVNIENVEKAFSPKKTYQCKINYDIAYQANRYKNDEAYKEKMKQKSRDYYQRKKAEKAKKEKI